MPVFHTEMQRIDGNAQSPLQLARVDDSIDPNFDPEVMIEVIERGSAVHCVSAYEGDIVVLGSDGVFDNLFVDEIVAICSEMLDDAGQKHYQPLSRTMLGECAKRIVHECHAKTLPPFIGSPIGMGGKVDDTACVVGEVVEWTNEHSENWAELRRQRWWGQFATCGGGIGAVSCQDEFVVGDDFEEYGKSGARVRNYPTNPNGSFSTYMGSFNESMGGSFASFLPPSSSFADGYGSVRRHEMGRFESQISRNRSEDDMFRSGGRQSQGDFASGVSYASGYSARSDYSTESSSGQRCSIM